MSLTEEQIKEALESKEGKAAIDAAVEAAKKGLQSKNAELLSEVKDIKKKLNELEEAKENAEKEAATKGGNVEALEKAHKKELEKRDNEIQKLSGQLTKNVLGKGLTEALVKANVSPDYMEAAVALINTKFKGEVGDNDGVPFAKFDGRAVEEFVTGWAQSDEGKRFVTAAANSGGGSNGANGKGRAGTENGKKTMTRGDFENLSPAEKSKFSVEGGQLTDG